MHISSFVPHAHVLYGKGKTLNALEIVVTYILVYMYLPINEHQWKGQSQHFFQILLIT